MRRLLPFFLAAILAGGSASAQEGQKLALVIGNDTYDHVAPLERAVADARAYRDVLTERRGFEVFYAENADRAQTFQTVFEFLGRIEPGDVVMVVYAGHGVQLDPDRRDTLFLLPTDIPAVDPGQGAEEAFLDANALNFAKIADWVQERGAKLRIFVLDACRDNPFAARGTRAIGVSRGLGQITSSNGEFIFYSAGPGQQALDRLPGGDESPNSVFTRVFLEQFQEGTYLEDIANNVQERVLELARLARFEQTPYYSDGVPGKTCLEVECGTAIVSVDPEEGTLTDADPGSGDAVAAALEDTYWRFCETNDNPAYCEAYLTKYPEGPRALLARLRLEELQASAGGEPGEPVTGGELLPPDPEGGEDVATGGDPTEGNADGTSGDGGSDEDGTRSTDPDRGAAIAREWAELGDSYDYRALRGFIESYPGTREATEAEARLAVVRDFHADGQRELNRIGYNAGPVDGLWGQRSARALARFQRAEGLRQTGVLTDDLLRRLRAAAPIPRTVVAPDPEPTRRPDPVVDPVIPTPVPVEPEVVYTPPKPTPVPEPSSSDSRSGNNFGGRAVESCAETTGPQRWDSDCF